MQGNNDCVEVAILDSSVRLRDSKDPDGGTLVFTIAEWASFVSAIQDGEFAVVPGPTPESES